MKKISSISTITAILYSICLSISLRIIIPENVYAQVKVIKAPANYEFRDMGYDSVRAQVGIVGYEVSGATKTAKVFGLNANRDGFTSTTLVGLGSGTQVFGISSDATRVAGLSKSPSSSGEGEATTWLKNSPSSPIAIGYSAGLAMTSRAQAAWKDGVVGDSGGALAVYKWSSSTGLITLPGNANRVASVFDTNVNGTIQVGLSSHQNFSGAAYYWDNTGIHKLNDTINNSSTIQSVAYSISPNGSYIGGYVLELDNTTDISYDNAAVWDANRNLILLKDANGNRFQGRVLDISNLGYAVGETIDGKGFIWHPSFTGAKIFENWLTERQATYSPTILSKGVEAIAEDRINGKLIFALSDYEAPGASFYVEVEAPEIIEQDIQYALWNSFIGMWDILELVNDTSSNQNTTIKVYNIAGQLIYTQDLVLTPGEQKDLLVHDFEVNGQKVVPVDSYGIITIEGDITGRLFYYRPTPIGFDFGFAIPLLKPSTDTTYVGFNTYEPSGAPTYNWLSLVNLADSPKKFTIRRYKQDGTLLLNPIPLPLYCGDTSTQEDCIITLPASSRTDIDGGHTNPGRFNVGLLEIIPADTTSPYIGQLVRYGIQNSGAIDFAFPLLAKAASNEDLYVPVNTKDNADNWLEVVNPNANIASVTIDYYNASGTLTETRTENIPAKGQLHFYVNSAIGSNQIGHVQLSSTSAIISQSMVYEMNKPGGSLLSMYGIQASDQYPLTGKISTSYNLFIGMDNLLRVNNLTDIPVTFNLKIASPNAVGSNQNVTLAARESKDLNLKDAGLYGTAASTYGSVVITTPNTKQVQAHVLRKHYVNHNSTTGALDFAAPTVAQ